MFGNFFKKAAKSAVSSTYFKDDVVNAAKAELVAAVTGKILEALGSKLSDESSKTLLIASVESAVTDFVNKKLKDLKK